MASTTFLSIEQYLHAAYEGIEPEFVHGCLIERSMPTLIHGWLQALLVIRLSAAGAPVIAVRMRLAPDVIRIPDIALYTGSLPDKQVPTEPPLVVIEIISPDDRYSELMKKFEEYRTWGVAHAWGVAHIWIVEPELRKFHIYQSGGLFEANQFELLEQKLRIDAAELFAAANQ